MTRIIQDGSVVTFRVCEKCWLRISGDWEAELDLCHATGRQDIKPPPRVFFKPEPFRVQMCEFCWGETVWGATTDIPAIMMERPMASEHYTDEILRSAHRMLQTELDTLREDFASVGSMLTAMSGVVVENVSLEVPGRIACLYYTPNNKRIAFFVDPPNTAFFENIPRDPDMGRWDGYTRAEALQAAAEMRDYWIQRREEVRMAGAIANG